MNGDADLGRKRKNCLLTTTLSTFNTKDVSGEDREPDPDPDNDLTALSLSFRPSRQRLPSPTPIPLPLPLRAPLDRYSLQSPPLLQLQPQPPQIPVLEDDSDASPVPTVAPPIAAAAIRGCGHRKFAGTAAKETVQNKTIVPPYPWATDRRATVHSFESLVSRRILAIQGTVQCKKCEMTFEIEYDLKQRFIEIGRYVTDNKESMRDRAPPAWMNPVLPRCKFCDQDNSAKPVFPPDKDGINWLFLLLGQMIGCCTLDQLKYFCEHTKNHRSGAKDRIVYYTYLGLCKQLDPAGPFDP